MVTEEKKSIEKTKILPYKDNSSKSSPAGTIKEVNRELLVTMNETTNILQKEACETAIPYILWNDFLNRYGTFTPKITKTYTRYKYGDKVFVDFGATNIQTEISFPHPGIVLFNLAQSVIVVPTTSDDSPIPLSPSLENTVIKVKKDGVIFPKDTVINLTQICSVHKERIIKKLNGNVRNYIVENTEIDRLNSHEKFRFFQYGSNLLECIRMKMDILFNKEQLEASFFELAYIENENTNLKITVSCLKDDVYKLQKQNDILQG